MKYTCISKFPKLQTSTELTGNIPYFVSLANLDESHFLGIFLHPVNLNISSWFKRLHFENKMELDFKVNIDCLQNSGNCLNGIPAIEFKTQSFASIGKFALASEN